MKKQHLKKGHAHREVYVRELTKQLCAFIADCKGKSDAEIKDLYVWYEKNWHEFVNIKNNKNRSDKTLLVMGFTDAFESSVYNGYKTLKEMRGLPKEEYLHYKRVFNLFRKRSIIFEIFSALFSKN